MSSQHRHPVHGFRPDPEDYDAARAHLEARGHTIGSYLRACVQWAARDSDAALAALAPHSPSPRPLGRPAANAQPRPQEGDGTASGSSPKA
jgi:hypothetical protein